VGDAGLDQLRGNFEPWRKRVIFGLYLRVGQQSSFEPIKRNGHVTSFARFSASSISARGVFGVFFTNARTDGD
jgi:hypothetical protein